MGTQLTAWFSQQLTGATGVWLDGLSRLELGHSAEMMLLTLHWTVDGAEQTQDVVVRLRPPFPGLLEPYDLRRQYDVLKALEGSTVTAPRALWIEETGDVLGRAFYVMERLGGEAFELQVPGRILDSPELTRTMATRVIEQIAAIHQVDLVATGLTGIGDGRGFLDGELDHWAAELQRVQLGPLPALERLIAELRAQRPAQTPRTTLVHGDVKSGNFAFDGPSVSAVFDWEMVSVGDPMTDIGYAEFTWKLTPMFGKLSESDWDALLLHYEELTGVRVHDRAWHRALQALKISVITLVGSMHFDSGDSDDDRFAMYAMGIPFLTKLGLDELGVTDDLEPGPVAPRQARVEAARAAKAASAA